MAQYISKTALEAEIERLRMNYGRVFNEYDAGFSEGRSSAFDEVLSFLNTLKVKEINNVWHDARRTIPEDGSEQIICIKEDGLAVSTVGKIVNGTIKWAYLGDLQDTNSFNVKVKEVEEEPVSNDLEEAAWLYYDKNRLPIPPEWDLHKEFIDFFKAGAKWQKTKAYEWLKEHKEHPLIGCEDPCLSGYLTDEFIEDFKKAMEE